MVPLVPIIEPLVPIIGMITIIEPLVPIIGMITIIEPLVPIRYRKAKAKVPISRPNPKKMKM